MRTQFQTLLAAIALPILLSCGKTHPEFEVVDLGRFLQSSPGYRYKFHLDPEGNAILTHFPGGGSPPYSSFINGATQNSPLPIGLEPNIDGSIEVEAISGDGAWVVTEWIAPATGVRFLWNREFGRRPIEASALAIEGEITAINGSGEMVWNRWRPNLESFLIGSATVPIVLDGSRRIESRDINSQGFVVGAVYQNWETYTPFFWSKSGESKVFDFPGIANSINDHGEIVGMIWNPSFLESLQNEWTEWKAWWNEETAFVEVSRDAFLIKDGDFHNLNECVPSNFSGRFEEAHVINNSGLIVCEGTVEGDSERHVFLLRPEHSD